MVRKGENIRIRVEESDQERIKSVTDGLANKLNDVGTDIRRSGIA